MSKQASEFQVKAMARMYRGKEIFKPLNTGWADERVRCVREYVANVFFYTKDGTTIMIDAGYNYPRLAEKMSWLGLNPAGITDILLTHQDTDHVGAVEADSAGLFRGARLYLSREEDRYLTGEVRRRVFGGLYALPPVTIPNEKTLLADGQVLRFGSIKVETLAVPGHTWGHVAYLIDERYLFTGDAIWLGADGGYSFINVLAESNRLATASLALLKKRLAARGLRPAVFTGHTGWTEDFDFAFAHVDKVCNALRRRQTPHDPTAPLDGYDEAADTAEAARAARLPQAYRVG